jgi:hypothetical protein
VTPLKPHSFIRDWKKFIHFFDIVCGGEGGRKSTAANEVVDKVIAFSFLIRTLNFY